MKELNNEELLELIKTDVKGFNDILGGLLI
jgi:hypothetical protein